MENENVLFGALDGSLKYFLVLYLIFTSLYSLYPHKLIHKFENPIKAPMLGMSVSNDDRIIATLVDDFIIFYNLLEISNEASKSENTPKSKKRSKNKKNVDNFNNLKNSCSFYSDM